MRMIRTAFREATSLVVAVLVAGTAHSSSSWIVIDEEGGIRVDEEFEIRILDFWFGVDEEFEVRRLDGTGTAAPAAAQPGAGGGAYDMLELGSRGQLHGRLRAVETGEDMLLWDHPSAHNTLDFSLKNNLGVILGERPRQGTKHSPSTLWFANNDLIQGRVKEVTPEIIVFDTWYAGTLEIPRNMVRRLAPGVTGGTLFYDGLDGADDWNQRPWDVGWHYEGGTLRALGGAPMGRRFAGLSGLCHFYFDISWTGDLNFFFSFYAEDENVYNRNAYALRFEGDSVQPHHFDENGQSRAIGDRVHTNLLDPAPEGRRVRVSLYVNKHNGEITVDVNGTALGVWKDDTRSALAGEAVVIQQLMLGLTIHDMRIEQWSGAVLTETDPDVESRTDVLSMTNNDRVSGRMLSMTGDAIRFETPFATVDLPVSKVRTIHFSTVGLQTPRRGEHPTRAYFASYGHLTFDLLRIADDQVEGRSDATGSFSIPLSALRKLQFNPLYTLAPAAETADPGASPQPPRESIRMRSLNM